MTAGSLMACHDCDLLQRLPSVPVRRLGPRQPGQHPLFEPGDQPFSVSLILKGPAATGWQWLADKMGADGWVIQTKGGRGARTCR